MDATSGRVALVTGGENSHSSSCLDEFESSSEVSLDRSRCSLGHLHRARVEAISFTARMPQARFTKLDMEGHAVGKFGWIHGMDAAR